MDNAFGDKSTYENVSHKVHKITAGVLMLSNKLDQGQPTQKEVKMLKAFAI